VVCAVLPEASCATTVIVLSPLSKGMAAADHCTAPVVPDMVARALPPRLFIQPTRETRWLSLAWPLSDTFPVASTAPWARMLTDGAVRSPLQ
jgi:hypothetical protein